MSKIRKIFSGDNDQIFFFIRVDLLKKENNQNFLYNIQKPSRLFLLRKECTIFGWFISKYILAFIFASNEKKSESPTIFTKLVSFQMDNAVIRGRKGTLHFIRFPTSEMSNFLILARAKGMATLVTTVCATGGGAYKFEENFRSVRPHRTFR